MHPRLTRALRGLDAVDHGPGDGTHVDIFVRDDDAGWDHDALLALLDVTTAARVPVDLAVIPAVLDDRIVASLSARIDAAVTLVGVHQHGYAHANHEVQGRRCEFGSSREAAVQHDDIARGRRILRDAFDKRLDPFFTPPWNRCTAVTGTVLTGLGYTVLSRDRRASPPTVMPELAVDVDWSRAWREEGVDGAAHAIATAIEARMHAARDGRRDDAALEAAGATPLGPVGLMLHHGAMDHEERMCLGRWLVAMREHPRMHWRLMRECLPMAAATRGLG